MPDKISAKIIEVKELYPGHRIFRILPEHKIIFKPGQYTAIGVLGATVERAYSIASSPESEIIEFYIELVENGRFTPTLFRLKKGDTITLRKPVGSMLFNPETRNHLMVSTVTGISPLLSMARANAGKEYKIFFLNSASYQAQLGFRKELEAMSKKKLLTYIPSVSRPDEKENASWHGETGRVETKIKGAVASGHMNPQDTTAYLCGHPGMIKNAEEILSSIGFPEAKIKKEFFWR